jgi:hypothetical protein
MRSGLEQKIEREAAEGEAQRSAAYLQALRRERDGVEAGLRRLRNLEPDEREWMSIEGSVYQSRPAGERASEAEARLADIDRELARVEEQ